MAQVVPHQILQENNFKNVIFSLNAPNYPETPAKVAALSRPEISGNDLVVASLFELCFMILVVYIHT